MSTLPPTPSFNKNVPVITPGGGSSAAYANPNSPESILRKTASLEAQVAVDSKFDVNQSPYHDGFENPSSNSYTLRLLLSLVVLIFITLTTFHTLKFSAKAYMLAIAVFIIFLVIRTHIRND
jgi:hypothetical protein